MEMKITFPGPHAPAIVRAIRQDPVKRHVQDPPEFVVTTSRGLPA